MDDRLRDVEGDVVTLKDWRKTQVDPWLIKSVDFHQKIGDFVVRMEAREKMEDELQRERHETNSSKMNLMLVLATISLALFALLSLIVAYQALHQHSLLIPFDLHSSTQSEQAQQAGSGAIHF